MKWARNHDTTAYHEEALPEHQIDGRRFEVAGVHGSAPLPKRHLGAGRVGAELPDGLSALAAHQLRGKRNRGEGQVLSKGGEDGTGTLSVGLTGNNTLSVGHGRHKSYVDGRTRAFGGKGGAWAEKAAAEGRENERRATLT